MTSSSRSAEQRAEKIRNWQKSRWRPTYPDEDREETKFITDQIAEAEKAAEERGYNNAVNDGESKWTRTGFNQGFRAGTERMREMASKLVADPENETKSKRILAKEIRALPTPQGEAR